MSLVFRKGWQLGLQGLEILITLCLFFNFNPFYWLLLINLQMCSAICYLNKTPSLVPQAMIPCIVSPPTLSSLQFCSRPVLKWLSLRSPHVQKVPLSSSSPGSLQGNTPNHHCLCEILSSWLLGFYIFLVSFPGPQSFLWYWISMSPQSIAASHSFILNLFSPMKWLPKFKWSHPWKWHRNLHPSPE